MTITAITVPKWGLAMEEGRVTGWHVAEGASISAGDELVDVESSKIANVIEAPAEGVLRKIVAHDDTVLPVGGLLGVLAPESVGDEEIEAFVATFVVEAEDEDDAVSGPAESTVEAGQKIAYRELGSGEATVLFVHGFGGDKDNWTMLQSEAAGSHRTIALDLPGHGNSDKAIADASLSGLAQSVIRTAEALSLGPVHVVAHSLGGAVAAEIASAKPEMVSSLFLVAPAGCGSEVNLDYVEDFVAAERRKDMTKAAQMLFADPALASHDLVEALLAYKRRDGVEEALDAIAQGAIHECASRDAGTVTGLACPVRVVWGSEDAIVPPSAALEHTVIEGAGHLPQIERAAETGRALKEWLAQVTG